jgi:Domain of unknown function (DUF1906)
MLSGNIEAAPAGAMGFDCNAPLTSGGATSFVDQGFTFAVRYLARTSPQAGNNLSNAEAQTILAAGLALMAVQHFAGAGWAPTESLGQQYGAAAVANAQAVGLPPGVNVWLDLESVGAESSSADVIAYCNTWFGLVSAAGYAPGLYVGVDPCLTSAQLYSDLTVQYYWRSLSGATPPVATRGFCMLQSAGSGTIGGYDYDENVIQADAMNSTPQWLAPAAP